MASHTTDTILEGMDAALLDGDQATAMRLAADALALGVEDTLVLLLVAQQRVGAGRVKEALVLLRKASFLAPDEPEVWKRLANLLTSQEMHAEALAALESALTLEPRSFETLVVAGATSFRMGDLEATHSYYQRAADLEPNQPELLATLAIIAARREDCGAARGLAAQALALEPNAINGHMAIARADLIEGDADSAARRTTKLLARSDVGDESRIAALDLRADVFDKLGQYSQAFADYEARNEILAQRYGPLMRQSETERPIEYVRRLLAYFSETSAEPWARSASRDSLGSRTVRRHVFLVGFPRSGTTLLEKALAGHPEIVTLEEVDHLGVAGRHLLSSNAGLSGLANLPAAAAETCRQTYWNAVRKTLGESLLGRVLVDKLPLHTPSLPLIAKLFPDAKILFALRDPRDVVFSCFRRRFRMNAAMFEFLKLTGAAQYYDKTMRLANVYRQLLPLGIYRVRHEDVVADFDGEIKKILDFVGADWNPAVSDFSERAKAKRITPSDPQLARGLNANGIGQWRNYQSQLSPVLGVLEPWAREFGYPAARE